MSKQIQLAIISVFLIWSAIDYFLHDYILVSLYKSATDLWRATYDEKVFTMYLVVFVSALIFVCIFALFFKTKNFKVGLIYGFLFGISTGITQGYGIYASMPIPKLVAFGWFLGITVKGVIGGGILGLLVRESNEVAI